MFAAVSVYRATGNAASPATLSVINGILVPKLRCVVAADHCRSGAGPVPRTAGVPRLERADGLKLREECADGGGRGIQGGGYRFPLVIW
jgi:hypothetical protein